MNNLKFTVVIPLYNKAPHIKRAIDSVLRQTYGDFELIVVDDGSTDGGGEIVKQIQNPRIRLITQENQGVSVARNRGIELAAGEFVAFLDADDEWKPDYLQEISRLINRYPDCGMYATAYEAAISKNPKRSSRKNRMKEPWSGILTRPFLHFQHGLPFYTSSVVIPKPVLRELGGFRVDVRRGEDMIMWNQIALGYPIAFCASNLVVYHKDAINRISRNMLAREKPTETMRLVFDQLENRDLDLETRQDLNEYYNYMVVIAAREALFTGKPKIAKKWLSKIKNNSKYSTQRCLLQLLCLLPPIWVVKAYRRYKDR